MQIKSLVMVVASVAAGLCFAGNTYYVDPANGNDAWDGSTSALPTEEQKLLDPVPGPRETLVGVMELVTTNNGDIVYAAPGFYTNKTITIDGIAYRVAIPTGTKLISTGTRENTFLVGEKDLTTSSDLKGCGPNAVRCGHMAASTEIHGFTVTGGRDTTTTKSSDTLPGGLVGASKWSRGLAYDCTFSNLVTKARAAALLYVTSHRCYFAQNESIEGNGDSFQMESAYNCVFGPTKGFHGYYVCYYYNCTFLAPSARGGCRIYNTLILTADKGKENSYYNCLYTAEPKEPTGCKTNGACRLVTLDEVPYDKATYMPLAGSLAIDAGDNSYVKPSLESPYADYLGNARVYNGTVDVGAVEAQAVIVSDTTGLDMTGLTGRMTLIPAGGIHATIARNYKTTLKVKGIRINGGDLFEFDGTTADRVWEGDFAEGTNVYIEVVYVDKNTFYVDPVNGNDANTGYTPYSPRETLASVMELVTTNAGDIVYAAPGFYTNKTVTVDGIAYRVAIPKGTKLIATGTRENTFLVGEKDTTSATTWKGCGPNAVRCGHMDKNTEIRGFTVTGGRDTEVDPATPGDTRPGGLYGVGFAYNTSSTSCAYDCIFSNLVTRCRSAAVFHVAVYGCYFEDITAGDCQSAVFQSGYAYNCVFGESNCSVGYFWCHFFNCTFLDRPPYDANVYNSLILCPENKYSATYHNCIFTAEPNESSKLDADCQIVSAAEAPYDPVTFVPLAGSLAIDAGSNSYMTASTTDYRGNARIYNGTVDIGAVEARPAVTVSDIAGLDMTGLESGTTPIPATGIHATIARNYKTALKVKGIRINGGDLFEFEGDGKDNVWEGDFADGADVSVEVVYVDKNDWYVDAVNGDDANDGYTWYRARKTLVKAMALPNLKSGEIVHAAAGSYDEGEVWQPNGDDHFRGSNRVVVVAGVGLVATNAETTLIVGRPHNEKRQNGLGAVRCVFLNEGSWVENFTITNGFNYGAWGGNYAGYGGGVCLAETATDGAVVGCHITGCFAISCPFVYGATVIRCAVDNPIVVNNQDLWHCKAIIDSACLPLNIAECPLVMNSCSYNLRGSTAYNSYCYFPFGSAVGYTCRSYYKFPTTNDAYSVKGLYWNPNGYPPFMAVSPYRPLTTDANFCDKGNYTYYTNLYPKAWIRYMGKDCTGGQRVYNGKIDIGPGEADWRDVYTAAITNTQCSPTVEEAGPGVTAGTRSLNLADGDTLTLRIEAKMAGFASVRVVSAGNVTVTSGDVAATKDGDVYRIQVPQGVSEVKIAVAGASAVVSNIYGPKRGLLIIVK